MILFKNQDKENILVKREFLRYNGSSLKDGSFEFFIVVEFCDDIFVEGIEEFGEHGFFFLFLFERGLDISIWLLWMVGVLLE